MSSKHSRQFYSYYSMYVKSTNKIGLDPLMLVDETLVDLVTLQQIIAGLLKWHMRSTLVKLQETISIPEVIF